MKIEKRREEVAIDKDIPLPSIETRGRKLGAMCEALMKMEIGDSILLKTISRYRNAHRGAKRVGVKLTSRRCEDGWRIWRVA